MCCWGKAIHTFQIFGYQTGERKLFLRTLTLMHLDYANLKVVLI